MALSPDERFIAVGDQGSQHLLLNPCGEVLGQWAPLSACAHHATFTHDSTRLLAHSCHLYTGHTGVLHLPPEATGAAFMHIHRSQALPRCSRFIATVGGWMPRPRCGAR